MSSVVENRAAVFTSQPQVVEVHQAGVWWPGQLLGWRHDETGACRVWVRVVVDGAERTSWTDLDALRLPVRAPEPAVRRAPRTEEEGAPEEVAPVPAGVPVDGEATANGEATASLPLARDHVTRGAAAPARSGGRRRAPEDADVQVARASSVPVPSPGRHRARSVDPAAGRHRDADTALLPTVAREPAGRSRRGAPAQDAWAVPGVRPAAEPVAGGPAWSATGEELLTRPMRLTDSAPHSRRPRLVAL